jgi:hypothetical protein
MNSVATGREDSSTDPRTRPLNRRRIEVAFFRLEGFADG